MGDQGATRYRLVVLDFRARHAESLAGVLERVLGMPTARAQQLAGSLPCTVGSTARVEHARHYAAELRDAGAEVQVEPPLSGLESLPMQRDYVLGELALPVPVAPRPATPAPDLSPESALSLRAAGSAIPHTAERGMGGLRDLGESLEALAPAVGPALEVDEEALRAIRQVGAHQNQAPRSGLGERLARWLHSAVQGAAHVLPGYLAFAVVMAITAAAVSYALDPDHVLDEVAFTRAKESARALVAPLTALWARVLPES